MINSPVGMKNARLVLICCALNGMVLPAALAAPLPEAEFNWRAAPSEEQVATLTLREAILRAFARNPKISEAAAQIYVGEGDLSAAQSAWYPQISLQGRSGALTSNGFLRQSEQQRLWRHYAQSAPVRFWPHQRRH